MPSRILRDYTDSLPFDGISSDVERLFVRLIQKADDYGRFHAEPRLIRAHCYPLSDNIRTNDLTRWLDELSTRQLILRYNVSARPYLALVNFGQRLKLSRPKYPAPDGESPDFLPLSGHFREVPGSSGKFPPESESESDSETTLESDVDSAPVARDVEPSAFDRFWQAYPRKAGKGNAEKAWKAHKCESIAETILAAVACCAQSLDWKKDGGQFIPHPATWLNRRGWDDELPGIRPGGVATVPLRPEDQPKIWTPSDEEGAQ